MIQSSLAGVSCPARGVCSAVGSAVTPTGPATLAERFADGAWQIQQTTPTGAFPFLAGVSCPTQSACIAVGGSGFRSIGATLAESWSP